MAIFFNFYTTSNHLHTLQVENCDSNSRLVVDEDDSGKFRPETVKQIIISNFLSLEVVGRGSETQLQVGEILNWIT